MTVTRRRQHRNSRPIASRPYMPASYGIEPGAATGFMSWSAVREAMAPARNYWVATTRPDGRPHVMPVWGVWLEEVWYFATDPQSRKGRNLAANPRLVVHLESGDDVVILEGVAEEVQDSSLLVRFADAYEAKYRFRPDVTAAQPGVFRLRSETAFAWHEREFPKTATRWRFTGS